MNETDKLAGKTALVTGAARRIGRAVSVALAAAGANVVVHYRRSRVEAESLADDLRRRGVEAWTLEADLKDSAQAEDLLQKALALAGPVDILVNNASVFLKSRLGDLTPEALIDDMKVNALAPFLIARQFAGQGREGAIVNFLDTRVVDYDGEHVAYHLSKRLLLSLTRMMALESAPKVRVNAVAPGLILPPEGQDEGYLQRLAHTNPLQGYGSPDDVAGAVLFLLRSKFVTGQIIFVDGGRHLKGNAYG